MKQVAVVVKDDVTELNKRLASGFQVSTNYRLENGDHMFIMYKYEAQRGSENTLRSGSISPAVVNEYASELNTSIGYR